MYERHENEQYFFDEATLAHLTACLSERGRVACLCAPLLGRRLVESGVDVRILDIDDRFAAVPGFRHFDLHHPEWLDEPFDLIVCDPPFYDVSLSRLFAAIRVLARNDFNQELMVAYLVRRASAIIGTFERFGLAPCGYRPTYQTVQAGPRNEVEFFANFDAGFLLAPR